MLYSISHLTLELLLHRSFWRENVKLLLLCKQHCYGRNYKLHNVTKYENHWWFINFNTKRDITSKRGVM